MGAVKATDVVREYLKPFALVRPISAEQFGSLYVVSEIEKVFGADFEGGER